MGPSQGYCCKKAVEDEDSEIVPASFLQNHDNVTFVIDEAAASGLTRIKSPWLTGDCEWTPKNIKKPLSIWLCSWAKRY
ncbi:hypothetical protein LWM68_17115 [Niabella sp. W65]|nr:hypothetical protein [Niabella sp. W65]MCH7364320.1 hypothetical protein [Niabella sp. W65]